MFMIGHRFQKGWMLDWWPVIFPGAVTMLIGKCAFPVPSYEISCLYDSTIAYMCTRPTGATQETAQRLSIIRTAQHCSAAALNIDGSTTLVRGGTQAA